MGTKIFVVMLVLAVLSTTFGWFGGGIDFFETTTKAFEKVSVIATPLEAVLKTFMGGGIDPDQMVNVQRFHFGASVYIDVIHVKGEFFSYLFSKEADVYSPSCDVFDYVYIYKGVPGGYFVDKDNNLLYSVDDATSVYTFECTYYDYLVDESYGGGHRDGR